MCRYCRYRHYIHLCRVAEYETSCEARQCERRESRSWLGAGPVSACCSRQSASPYTSPDTPRPSTTFTCVAYCEAVHRSRHAYNAILV